MRRPAVIVALGLVFAARAGADDALHTGVVNLDRPTVVALGVQLLISGDDNHNAQVAVRYRAAGTAEWRSAMPLFRVHPESVVGRTVPEQLAGSIFDLSPGTTYEIELHATDPDGPVDQTITLANGQTLKVEKRALPDGVRVIVGTDITEITEGERWRRRSMPRSRATSSPSPTAATRTTSSSRPAARPTIRSSSAARARTARSSTAKGTRATCSTSTAASSTSSG